MVRSVSGESLLVKTLSVEILPAEILPVQILPVQIQPVQIQPVKFGQSRRMLYYSKGRSFAPAFNICTSLQHSCRPSAFVSRRLALWLALWGENIQDLINSELDSAG